MIFQDVKTKTINWCTKMRDEKLITPEQYNTCISNFINNTKGIIPKDFKVPSLGMPITYSLYNTRSEALTDNITGDNTNTVMLVTNTGLYMACDTNNKIYYIDNINDTKINQHEIYFTLSPQTNNVYGILSPYGRYLLTNTSYTADFSGTSLGPMSTWTIIKTNDSVSFESVIYAGFFLSFTNKDVPLQIIRGEDETAEWLMIPKKQNNINDQIAQYTGSEYIVSKERILTRIRNSAVDKIVLNIMKNTLITLQNHITENYSKIDKYMREKLTYDAEVYRLSNITYKAQIDSLSKSSSITLETKKKIEASIPKPTGVNITPIQINSILYNIANTKNAAIKLVDEEISKINTQIINLPLGDPMDEYVTFMNDINSEDAKTTLKIQQNNVIMGRQKDNYDSLNKDETYFNTKKNNYKNLDNSLKLNLNIIDSYKTQNQYLVYIYPIILIICICILLYLIYITYQTFMKNVYTDYS